MESRQCLNCGQDFDSEKWVSKTLSGEEAGIAAGEEIVYCSSCGQKHWNWTGEGLVKYSQGGEKR